MRALILSLVACAVVFAQGGGPGPITAVTTAPSGSCTSNAGQLVGPGGTIYTCQNGTWAQAGGGGSTSTQIAAGSVCADAGCTVNETANWTYAVMIAGTIKSCGAVATIAPTGSAIIVDVLLNGTSIYGANPKTTVAISSTSYAAVSTFASAAVVVGDLLTFKVTQADSNTIGQYVRVSCTIQ